ncbi:MAG: MIP family channel protein [Myxococcota bacterium]|nr:MIP family channel protein [Myxococcota bacterium]
MKRYAAEAIGTFALVFIGTGAICVDDLTGGALSHFGVSFAFGVVVMTMIYSVGEISGAHLNPAVTLGFWIARRFDGGQVMPYIVSQCVGAVLASGVLMLMFADHATLGATAPSGSLGQSFAIEVAVSFLLMFVILGVATGSKEQGIIAGLAIGATVSMCALFAGPISGASMNPARSLGPALIAGQFGGLWIYLTAPVAGAALAVGGCCAIREPGCCSR